MKKHVLSTTFTPFVILVMGIVLAFIGDRSIFLNVIDILGSLFGATWYLLIPVDVALVVLIFNLFFKARRRDRNVFLPFAMLLAIVGYLFVFPSFIDELLSGALPHSLLFTTGSALTSLAFVWLFVAALVNTIWGKSQAQKDVDEDPILEEEIHEVVNEDGSDYVAVEYSDEEKEDEEELELESDEEAETRKESAKKDKKARKDGDKDKEFDRIYHVMKRAKDDRWIVKIAQSRKAIKIFDTQKEAIGHAEALARNNNGVVRVFASKGANKGRIIT